MALIGAATMAPAWAEENRKDGHDARVAIATEVIAVCGERKQIETFFEKSAEYVAKSQRAQTPTFSDAQWRAYQTIIADDLKKDIDSYLAYNAESYAQYFTVSDMQAMEAYCRSPVGQKMSNVRAQMEADTFAYRQEWMRAALTAAMSDAQQKVQAGGSAL